jgi:lipopolysaccharide transport system ATP-binding protein
MSDVAISVEGLSKQYRLGQFGSGTLKEDVGRAWARLRGKPDPFLKIGETDHGNRQGETIWALRNVTLEVNQGDVVGIIGRNGAGKSTLLKILSRTTAPTSGQVKVKGRIASLLEVGTGFHPDLTGRENIYLNGAILGMRRNEIDRKFDEIVAFAEIGEFLDTPVKRYSSGMYVRLAFAVAAHLEPEILLVDEVLAVGDAAFQRKCLGKMGAVAIEGRTVVFVSHNMVAVQNLCPTCAWIDAGSLRQVGQTADAIHAYLGESATIGTSGEIDLARWPNRYGSGEARIISARLLDLNGEIASVMHRWMPMTVEFVVESQSPHALHLSASVVADSGARVLHLSHHDTPGLVPGVLHGYNIVRLTIPHLPLCAGGYSLLLAVHTENLIPIDVVTDILPFVAEDVSDSPRPYRTVAEYGYCWAPNHWSVAPLSRRDGAES